MAQLQLHATGTDRADERKAKLEVRVKPLRAESISSAVEVGDDVFKIKLHEIRKHEAVMQVGAPGNQLLPIWLAPELGDEGAYPAIFGGECFEGGGGGAAST